MLGVFFAKFFSQMHMDTMSETKAWILFVMASVGIHFKNWMQYTGKKRMVINAKLIKKKKPTHNIWLLFLLPIAALGLAFVLYQAV